MPQLFVLAGPDVGRSFELDRPVVLGRAEECDIRLKDRSISRHHARIEREGDQWVVVDLGSRNGVHLRGERVERAVLADQDEILLGELPVRFRVETAAAAPAPAPPRLVPEAQSPPPAPPQPAPPPPTAPPKPPSTRPVPLSTAEADGGFELEEEIELARAPTRIAPAPPRPRIEPELTERDLARARILAESRPSSIFSGDLSQWPLPLRWGVYALVVALAAGLFYGAFKLVASMRGGA